MSVKASEFANGWSQVITNTSNFHPLELQVGENLKFQRNEYEPLKSHISKTIVN